MTPLFWACCHGKDAAVAALLELGANPDARPRKGWARGLSPAMMAALNGHAHVLALLGRGGADLDAGCAWQGKEASSYRASDIGGAMSMRVAHAARKGYTATMYAVLGTNQGACIRALAEAGAHVNAKAADGTHKGRTALEFAEARDDGLSVEAIEALKKLSDKGFFGKLKNAKRSLVKRISPKNKSKRISPTAGARGSFKGSVGGGGDGRGSSASVDAKQAEKLRKMM